MIWQMCNASNIIVYRTSVMYNYNKIIKGDGLLF